MEEVTVRPPRGVAGGTDLDRLQNTTCSQLLNSSVRLKAEWCQRWRGGRGELCICTETDTNGMQQWHSCTHAHEPTRPPHVHMYPPTHTCTCRHTHTCTHSVNSLEGHLSIIRLDTSDVVWSGTIQSGHELLQRALELNTRWG